MTMVIDIIQTSDVIVLATPVCFLILPRITQKGKMNYDEKTI